MSSRLQFCQITFISERKWNDVETMEQGGRQWSLSGSVAAGANSLTRLKGVVYESIRAGNFSGELEVFHRGMKSERRPGNFKSD
jgi:hypothetical protein